MKLFNNNGHHIHYRFIDNQKEITFLLINSLGTDFRIWDSVIPALETRGNLILYDKRGHGLSDFVPAKNGLEDYAEDVNNLLSELKIKNCVPIGISVGGMIAQLLAHKNPGLVSKLVLCDTAHKIGTEASWNDRISQVQNGGIKTISDAVMKRWFSVSFHEKSPEIIAGYKNMLERCLPSAYIHTCEAIRDADLTEISKSLEMPTLCIVGADDLSTSPTEVEAMSNLIRGSKFAVIPDSAHLPCIDSAEKFNKLIIDFLK
jgi:3-oxoadipate enol-lactonase